MFFFFPSNGDDRSWSWACVLFNLFWTAGWWRVEPAGGVHSSCWIHLDGTTNWKTVQPDGAPWQKPSLLCLLMSYVDGNAPKGGNRFSMPLCPLEMPGNCCRCASSSFSISMLWIAAGCLVIKPTGGVHSCCWIHLGCNAAPASLFLLSSRTTKLFGLGWRHHLNIGWISQMCFMCQSHQLFFISKQLLQLELS